MKVLLLLLTFLMPAVTIGLYAADVDMYAAGIDPRFLTNDGTAFKKLTFLIHNNNVDGLYDYLEHTMPVHGWPYVFNFFVSKNGLPVLYQALAESPQPNKHIIGVLLHYGANPNMPIGRVISRKKFKQGTFWPGWTAAHIANRVRIARDIKYLLWYYGCDFSRPDDNGWTPDDVKIWDMAKNTVVQ